MATVRAKCEICGEVDLGSAQVKIRLCADTGVGEYSFTCPSCDLITSRPAERTVVDMLVEAGSPIVVWRLPAELNEPRPTGSPLTHADVEQFRALLQQDDSVWIDALTDDL